MARNAGGCKCWPTMTQNKGEGGTGSAAHSGFQTAMNAVTKEALSEETLAESSLVGEWRPQSIPKEHDHLIEMLFPPLPPVRHRSRNPFHLATSSLFSSSSKRRKNREESSQGSVRWFRDRSNSLLPPPRPDPMEIISTVCQDTCCRSGGEFSAELAPRSLPTSGRIRSNSSREFQRGQGTEKEKEWPDYILRLDRKMDHKCTCTGCKDTCTRTYGRPNELYNVGAYFDNEFYYNAQSKAPRDKHPMSRRPRELDEQTRGKNVVVCCTEAELYYIPSPPPPSPPLPTSGSISLGRSYFAPKKPLNERSDFTADDPDYWSWISPHGRPDRLDVSSRRVEGSVGLGGAMWWKPDTEFDDWMRIQASGSEMDPDLCDGDGGYMESDAGIQMEESDEVAVSPSGTPDGHVGLNLDFNRIVPSGMFHEKNNRISFESEDYLTPNTSSSMRFFLADGKVEKMHRNYNYSDRYLAMDSSNSRLSRDQKEAAAEDTFKSSQKREINRSSQQSDFRHDRCQAPMRKEELGAHRLLTDASINRHTNKSFAREQQEMETKTEFEENVKTDCRKDRKQEFSIEASSDETVNSLSIDSHQENGERERKAYYQTSKLEIEESHSSFDIDDDLTVTAAVEKSGPGSDEREASVRPKEHTAPPLALRSCSQLDLLLMSPPPQCSFMIEHPYVNITNNYHSTSCNEVDYKDRRVWNQSNRQTKEMEKKEAGKRRQDICLLEGAVKEMTISKTEAAPWQGATCKKNPVSPHVKLYRKFVNDYCHTYLPTPTGGLASVCRTD